MILLLPGNIRAFRTLPDKRDFGWLLTPRRSMNGTMKSQTHSHDMRWAIDNECFSLGPDFDFERYVRFVKRARENPGTCLFVTVPDVVSDAKGTHEHWKRYAPILRRCGLPLAYVAQDGMDELPGVKFDALFIGGSTEYKLSQVVADLIRAAHTKGKWVHVGRVNTPKRILHFWHLGADSFDGTAWALAPDEHLAWAKPLLGWLHQQPILEGIS